MKFNTVFIISLMLGGLVLMPVGLSMVMILVWIISSFFLVNQHVAIALVQLELLTLAAALLLMNSCLAPTSSFLFVFVLLSIGVVEAAVGLAVLASYSRRSSKELMKLYI